MTIPPSHGDSSPDSGPENGEKLHAVSFDLPQGRYFPLVGVVESYDGLSENSRTATLADVLTAADLYPDHEVRVVAPQPEQITDNVQRFHSGDGQPFYYDDEFGIYYE